MKTLNLIALIILSVACSSYGKKLDKEIVKDLAEESTGAIGCPEEEIQISNKKTKFSSTTWTATCRGEKFYCSEKPSTKEHSIVKCAPEVKAKK